MQKSNLFLTGSQVDDDPTTVLANTNSLLSIVGISAKKVTSIGELTRVASSMFVAVFESLFHVRLEGIIRNPQTKEEYAHNAQRVIDSLSERIQMDLQHITGDLIVRGDIGALSNLVHIFIRIVSMTSQESQGFSGMDIYLKGKKETRRNKRGDDLGDSISTHESTFQFQLPGDFDGDNDFLQMSSDMRGVGMGVNDFLKSSRNVFQQEAKLEAARKRRMQQQKVHENRTKLANKRRSEASIRALQKRWVDDTRRGEKAHQLRQQNEEHVMLRKMYRGLLKKMHEWKADENREIKRKEDELKSEANWYLQSLQSVFDDRLQLLRDEVAQKDVTVVKAQRQMGRELRKSFKDQQQTALSDLQDVVEHKREHELTRRREAQKNLLALVSVEKWDQMLRSYDNESAAERVFRPRQRSRSAPPSSSMLNPFELPMRTKNLPSGMFGGQNITLNFGGPVGAAQSQSPSKSTSSSANSSPTTTSAIKENDFPL
jgi:hypothetical protein